MLKDIIIIAVIVVIIGLASFYIYKSKKSGKKCIGCPDSCCCSGKTKCSGCGQEK
ncbi:MAG: FeoB-associated Cys-rich membrane protein [Ruminococcaceae bacterium]|nr:FeoB-associated Cys-rich membrane protein [Oscillospiraceae bacterium]